MPIQWEQFSLVYITNTCSMMMPASGTLYSLFLGPAGACIPVASVFPIYVSPVQHVLEHCGMHKHIFTQPSIKKINLINKLIWLLNK